MLWSCRFVYHTEYFCERFCWFQKERVTLIYKKSLVSVVLLLHYNCSLNLRSSVNNPSKVIEVFKAEMILLVYRNDLSYQSTAYTCLRLV